MNTRDGLLVHRASVQSVNGGTCRVYIPSLLGGQVITVDSTTSPTVGSTVMVYSTSDLSEFFLAPDGGGGGGGGSGLPQGIVRSTDYWPFVTEPGMYFTEQAADFIDQEAPVEARGSTGTLTVFQGLGDDLVQMWMGDNTNTWTRAYTAIPNAWSAWVNSVRVPYSANQILVSMDIGDGQFAFYPTDAPAGLTPSYVHNQGTVASTWTIAHGLGWFPNALVIDSAGSEVEGDITQVSATTMRIVFSIGFTGIAYLS